MVPKNKPRNGRDVWHWIRLLYFVIFLFGACISGYVCYDLFRGELNLPEDPIDAAFLPPAPDESSSPLPPVEELSPTPENARAGTPAARVTPVLGLPIAPTPTRIPTFHSAHAAVSTPPSRRRVAQSRAMIQSVTPMAADAAQP